MNLRKDLDHPLTTNLQSFLIELFSTLNGNTVNYTVLRSYEDLPEQAGFDIDVLVQDEDLKKVLDVFQEIGQKHGLIVLKNKKKNFYNIAVFEVDHIEGKRTWLLFDLETKIAFNDDLFFKYKDFEFSEFKSGQLEIKVLRVDWYFLLTFLYAVAKGTLRAKHDLLKNLYLSDTALIKKRVSDTLSCLAAEVDLNALFLDKINVQPAICAKLRDALDIVELKKNPLKKETQSCLNRFKSRFSKYLFFKLFFIHYHKPLFFVLSGADGAGKTTVLYHVGRIIKGYPFRLKTFHHTTGWKKLSNPLHENKLNPKRIILKKIFRPVWHYCIPFSIRKRIVIFVDEKYYCIQVNNKIGKGFYGHKIMISDRYCYDQHIKTILMKKTELQIRYSKIFSLAMRKPKITFIVWDEPERIYARKQEFTVEEIATYQESLLHFLHKHGIRSEVVKVDSRSPEEIAKEIVKIILTTLDKEVFPKIFSGKKDFWSFVNMFDSEENRTKSSNNSLEYEKGTAL